MKIESLGNITDFITLKFHSKIIERDEYIVIQTPSEPDYFWGNYILFKQAPQSSDYKR